MRRANRYCTLSEISNNSHLHQSKHIISLSHPHLLKWNSCGTVSGITGTNCLLTGIADETYPQYNTGPIMNFGNQCYQYPIHRNNHVNSTIILISSLCRESRKWQVQQENFTYQITAVPDKIKYQKTWRNLKKQTNAWHMQRSRFF